MIDLRRWCQAGKKFWLSECIFLESRCSLLKIVTLLILENVCALIIRFSFLQSDLINFSWYLVILLSVDRIPFSDRTPFTREMVEVFRGGSMNFSHHITWYDVMWEDSDGYSILCQWQEGFGNRGVWCEGRMSSLPSDLIKLDYHMRTCWLWWFFHELHRQPNYMLIVWFSSQFFIEFFHLSPDFRIVGCCGCGLVTTH